MINGQQVAIMSLYIPQYGQLSLRRHIKMLLPVRSLIGDTIVPEECARSVGGNETADLPVCLSSPFEQSLDQVMAESQCRQGCLYHGGL